MGPGPTSRSKFLQIGLLEWSHTPSLMSVLRLARCTSNTQSDLAEMSTALSSASTFHRTSKVAICSPQRQRIMLVCYISLFLDQYHRVSMGLSRLQLKHCNSC